MHPHPNYLEAPTIWLEDIPSWEKTVVLDVIWVGRRGNWGGGALKDPKNNGYIEDRYDHMVTSPPCKHALHTYTSTP